MAITSEAAVSPKAPAPETKSGRDQRTIATPASYSGIGIHTGARGEVTFRPAPPGSRA